MEEESKHEESVEEKSDGLAEPQEEAADDETIEKEEEAPEAPEIAETEEELPPTEEEVKPRPPKEVEEEFVEERFYTIPLGKAWISPPRKRAPRAMEIIKDFLKRHMKLEEPRTELVEEEEEPKRLIISNDLNERVWTRGIQKPPRRVRVRAAKDKDGNITVFLAE